jgi:hypothetical protein
MSEFTPWTVAPILRRVLDKAPPDDLWHYTSQEGLAGILKSRELWASDIRYSNDFAELQHGLGVIAECIDAKLAVEGQSEDRPFLQAMRQEFNRSNPFRNYFAVSWSACRDDLSQWRAYSGARTGYALVAKSAQLAALAAAQQFRLAPCIYMIEDQRECAEEIVSVSLQEMRDDQRHGVQYEHPGAGPTSKFEWRLREFAPLFKHPAFRAEEEWRLIPLNAPISPEAHQGRSMFVPHVSFRLSLPDVEFPINQIIVGPCADPGAAKLGAWIAAKEWTKHIIAMGHSAVPYRNW